MQYEIKFKLDPPVLTYASAINETPRKIALIWTNVELTCNYTEVEIMARDVSGPPDFQRIGIAQPTDTDAVVESGLNDLTFESGHSYQVAVQAYGGKGLAVDTDSELSNLITVTFS